MKFLMVTLLLFPIYSFSEDGKVEQQKECHIPTGRPNYQKIKITELLNEASCKKGDILWIVGLVPDNVSYVASRTCILKTITIGGTSVVCEYGGVVRELSSKFN